MFRFHLRLLACVVFAACTACGAATTSNAPAVNVPQATATATAASTAPAGKTSERGNFVKQVGETAGFGPTQDNIVVTFVVDKITVGAKCSGQFTQKPEHGNFVRLDIRAETKPTMPANSGYSINPFDFTTVGADGVTESSLYTGPAVTCLNPTEQMPPTFSPGSKYRGSIILDSKNKAGVVVFRPGFGGGAGWEWNYG